MIELIYIKILLWNNDLFIIADRLFSKWKNDISASVKFAKNSALKDYMNPLMETVSTLENTFPLRPITESASVNEIFIDLYEVSMRE